MTVQEIMTRTPVWCTQETPLDQVARMMVDCDCGQIPVVDEVGCCCGMVSQADIPLQAQSDLRI
jgi:CBS domain-containing protein